MPSRNSPSASKTWHKRGAGGAGGSGGVSEGRGEEEVTTATYHLLGCVFVAVGVTPEGVIEVEASRVVVRVYLALTREVSRVKNVSAVVIHLYDASNIVALLSLCERTNADGHLDAVGAVDVAAVGGDCGHIGGVGRDRAPVVVHGEG